MNKGFDYPRDFKGIWIPKEIWLDDDLNATDKIIFAEIDSLDVEDSEGCYASNEYLSNFCKCSITKVSTSISKLISLGYVRVAKSDGRKRWLKTCLSKFESQNGENKKSEIQEMNERNIPSKKEDKNIDKNNSLSSERASESESTPTKRQNRKKEANELFERVWKLYPKKIGKGQVSDTQKLRLLDIGYDELSRAVQRCCEYNKDKDKQYWQNGSTFFNSGYVDFLDENYEDSNSFSGAEVKESQKETLSEKERVRMGKEEAKEKLGYGEEYWDGMDDGQISVMLEYMGIFIDQY